MFWIVIILLVAIGAFLFSGTKGQQSPMSNAKTTEDPNLQYQKQIEEILKQIENYKDEFPQCFKDIQYTEEFSSSCLSHFEKVNEFNNKIIKIANKHKLFYLIDDKYIDYLARFLMLSKDYDQLNDLFLFAFENITEERLLKTPVTFIEYLADLITDHKFDFLIQTHSQMSQVLGENLAEVIKQGIYEKLIEKFYDLLGQDQKKRIIEKLEKLCKANDVFKFAMEQAKNKYFITRNIELAFNHYMNKNSDEALRLFEEAATYAQSLLVDISQNMSLVADIHFEKGDYQSAVEAYKQFLPHTNNAWKTFEIIAKCYVELNQLDEAIKYAILSLHNNQQNEQILDIIHHRFQLNPKGIERIIGFCKLHKSKSNENLNSEINGFLMSLKNKRR